MNLAKLFKNKKSEMGAHIERLYEIVECLRTFFQTKSEIDTFPPDFTEWIGKKFLFIVDERMADEAGQNTEALVGIIEGIVFQFNDKGKGNNLSEVFRNIPLHKISDLNKCECPFINLKTTVGTFALGFANQTWDWIEDGNTSGEIIILN